MQTGSTTKSRMELHGIIARRLAEVVELRMQLKQSQWNANDPGCDGLPELFERIAEELESCMDMVAGRIVQMGGVARGDSRAGAARTALAEYSMVMSGALARLNTVARSLSAFRRAALVTVGKASLSEDPVTAALFAEIHHGMEKWVRSVEAHTQASQSHPIKYETHQAGSRPRTTRAGRAPAQNGRHQNQHSGRVAL